MIIRIHHGLNPYVMIDKRCLDDRQLSWKAKGILAYLLSNPDDWTVVTEQLVKMSKEGKDAIRSAFRELRDAGYAELISERDDDGQMTGRWEWVIHELPAEWRINRKTENPSDGESATTKTDSKLRKKKTKGARGIFDEHWKARVGIIFGRRPTTLWDDDEEIAFASATFKLDDEGLSLCERYYAANRKLKDNICRRSPLTFLRHYQNEVDKSRVWCERHPLKGTRTIKAPAPEYVPPPVSQDPADIASRERIERELAERKLRKATA